MGIYHPRIIDKGVVSFNIEKPHNAMPPLNETGKLIDKVNKIFWVAVGCWATYNLLDSGISNFLALETLKHGTGPIGYIGINIFGADPGWGGSDIGSSAGSGDKYYVFNSKNYFHVFKDSKFSIPRGFFDQIPFNLVKPVYEELVKPLLPRMHAILSGMGTFNFFGRGSLMTGPINVVGGLAGFLTPTVKFRFTSEEVKLCEEPDFDKAALEKYEKCLEATFFENDPDYHGMAYRTRKAISASRLGITGSLLYGINSDMFPRMMANPLKVVFGAALIGAAAFVGRKTYQYYKNSSARDQMQLPVTISHSKQTSFQSFKQKAKKVAVGSCMVTLMVTAIFLNTL